MDTKEFAGTVKELRRRGDQGDGRLEEQAQPARFTEPGGRPGAKVFVLY